MAVEDTTNYIWNIYQQYDRMGMRIIIGDIEFYDNGDSRELGIRNIGSGKNIESISMGVISKDEFLKMSEDIVRKQYKSFDEYYSNNHENIWFSEDEKSAIAYAENVNEREGFEVFNVDNVHLVDEQLEHINNWQTWTDKDGV